MKISSFATLSLWISLWVGPSPSLAQTPDPSWQPFNKALEEARTSGKKTLVFIYTDWCPWCRKFQREVFPDSLVYQYMHQHFALTKLNAESTESVPYGEQSVPMRDLARALGGEGFPTITFLNEKGEYITRLPGFVPDSSFLIILQYIAEDAYKTIPFEEYMSKRQKSDEQSNR